MLPVSTSLSGESAFVMMAAITSLCSAACCCHECHHSTSLLHFLAPLQQQHVALSTVVQHSKSGRGNLLAFPTQKVRVTQHSLHSYLLHRCDCCIPHVLTHLLIPASAMQLAKALLTGVVGLCRSSGSLYANTSVSVAASALWRLPLVYLVMNIIRIAAITGQACL